MAFKMRGWSSHTKFHDIPKFPEKPKEYTEEEKKKFAEKEKQSIQNRIDRKEKKIKKKVSKGSTWGLARKKRKVAKLKKAKGKADGSATIRMMQDHDKWDPYQRSGFTKKKNKDKDIKSTISDRDAKGINIENVSAVQNKNGKNFVVEVGENEWYDPTKKDFIGGGDGTWKSNYSDTNNRRDTIVVSPSYKPGDLIDETDWETGKATKKKKKKK
jgi:hypothetical protein